MSKPTYLSPSLNSNGTKAVSVATTRSAAREGWANATVAAKPAMKKFIEAYSKVWGKGGVLEKKGLVPFGGADADAAAAQATALKPLDPTTLK